MTALGHPRCKHCACALSNAGGPRVGAAGVPARPARPRREWRHNQQRWASVLCATARRIRRVAVRRVQVVEKVAANQRARGFNRPFPIHRLCLLQHFFFICFFFRFVYDYAFLSNCFPWVPFLFVPVVMMCVQRPLRRRFGGHFGLPRAHPRGASCRASRRRRGVGPRRRAAVSRRARSRVRHGARRPDAPLRRGRRGRGVGRVERAIAAVFLLGGAAFGGRVGRRVGARHNRSRISQPPFR